MNSSTPKTSTYKCISLLPYDATPKNQAVGLLLSLPLN